MTVRPALTTPLLLALALTTLHCAGLNTTAQDDDFDPDTITDVATLADYFHNNRLPLISDGPFSSPSMTTPGHAFTPTSGGRLFAFHYPTSADALGAVSFIDGEGLDDFSRQLYRKEELVAIYIGDDPRIERALVRVFGSRIR